MNNINRFLLKGFIITVFFFYYEMRFFPLTLHSIFLFLGLLSMVISLAITTTKNGLAAVKIPHDVILALALSIVIIIGFVLTFGFNLLYFRASERTFDSD